MPSACLESISVQVGPRSVDTDGARVTKSIDQPGPSTTLNLIATEIKFDEKFAKAEAAAHSDGQSDMHDYQTEKKLGYDTDIRQFVRAQFAATGVSTRAEIQTMIFNKRFDYHANRPFPVVCKQAEIAIGDAIARDLLQNNQSVRQEINTTVYKAVVDTMRDRQAHPTVPRATRRAVESASFARDLSQNIIWYNTAVKPFATHAKPHVGMSDNR